MKSEEDIAATGRALEQSRWELPERYRLTQEALALPREELKKQHPKMFEVLELSEAKQREWAALAASPFGSVSPAEMERSRSLTIIENLEAGILELNKKVSAMLISGGEGNLNELQSAKLSNRHQLAERYAIIGRYDKAFENEPDPAYRERYMAVLEALWGDGAPCDCSNHRGSGDHAAIEAPTEYVDLEIFNITTGKPAFLMACTGCKGLRVVNKVPTHIREQRAHRARAQQIAGTLSPEVAARVLTNAGHTSARLLKGR